MAPILSVTAAEAWEHLHGLDQKSPIEESVFFADLPTVDDIVPDEELDVRWDRLLALRSEITKVLEAARREKSIGLSLDAEVLLQADADTTSFLNDNQAQLQELCIVSSLRVVTEAGDAKFVTSEEMEGLQVAVQPAPGMKCERCWTISPTVGEDSKHPALCSRCLAVVQELAD
jgi:isoleucyl-tRNA synthetase